MVLIIPSKVASALVKELLSEMELGETADLLRERGVPLEPWGAIVNLITDMGTKLGLAKSNVEDVCLRSNLLILMFASCLSSQVPDGIPSRGPAIILEQGQGAIPAGRSQGLVEIVKQGVVEVLDEGEGSQEPGAGRQPGVGGGASPEMRARAIAELVRDMENM